jgi:hypothetical protein
LVLGGVVEAVEVVVEVQLLLVVHQLKEEVEEEVPELLEGD